MTSGHWLCLHLDEKGRPCPRRTMHPLSMCSQHRPKAAGTHTRSPEAQREAMKRHRQRTSTAGMASAWETA
jgi:hypothetical protein